MAVSKIDESLDIIIPQDAVEVKITSIINPYFIRIQELPDDRTVKSSICRHLQKIVKSYVKNLQEAQYIPVVGDDIIVSSSHLSNSKVDLPDWHCRGIVTDTTKQTSNVFLLDYGISINVPTESLIYYSKSSVKFEPLTKTIGLYNILPIEPTTWHISEKWPKSTVDFIKNLIEVSTKIYFEVLACDRKNNKKYGDIYLVIENMNISLIKVLNLSCLAVSLYPKLLDAIRITDTTDEIIVPYEAQINNTNTEISTIYKNPVLNKIKNYTSFADKHIDKILIQSKFICRPLEHLEDARFTTSVHKALKNESFRTLKQIQSYMWPAIKEGLDTVAIGPEASGKTVGYIIPIANSIIINEEIFMENQNKCCAKPIALFLCATVKSCIDVGSKCETLLVQKINISTMCNGLSDKNVMLHVYNKFRILVSTPPFLLRTVKKYSNKLDLSEISYLVIDQADILLSKYLSELMTLIRKYKIINKNNKSCIQRSVQIIAVAQCWTDEIRSFVDTFMEDPYICIKSFTEAAAFSRVQGRMLIRHCDKKKEEVLNILNDYCKIKTLIFCLNSKEAIELNSFLISKSVRSLLVHEEMQITEVKEIIEDWNKYIPGMYPVVICTDEVLSELKISNIEFLIHYSVTNTSKTLFDKRFSVCMDNWQIEPKVKCKVLILFDETNDYKHFKGVVNILKRLNVALPEDWKQISEGLDLAHNMKIKNHPLCYSIRSFGICENNSCAYRHCIISEVDTPKIPDLMIGDELKLEVTHIHHASHFSARLCEVIRKCKITGNIKTIPYPYDLLKLKVEMIKYYKEQKNRRLLKDVCVGKTCTYRNVDSTYVRVCILNVVQKNLKTGKPNKVQLQSLDDGQIFPNIYVSELYEIPLELLEIKCTIIDVFLTGIAPFDEYEWTSEANRETGNWFKKNCSGTAYASIKVLLHVGNSIWTDSVVGRSKLIGYKDLISSSLTETLIKEGLATSNNDHLSKLVTMCHNSGITEINGDPLTILEKKNVNTSIEECD